MESGKFAALFVVVIAALGGVGWFSYSSVDSLRQEVAQSEAKNAASASEAKTLASQSIKAVDNEGAQMQKLAKQVADLTKQTQDSATALADTTAQVKELEAKPEKTALAKRR